MPTVTLITPSNVKWYAALTTFVSESNLGEQYLQAWQRALSFAAGQDQNKLIWMADFWHAAGAHKPQLKIQHVPSDTVVICSEEFAGQQIRGKGGSLRNLLSLLNATKWFVLVLKASAAQQLLRATVKFRRGSFGGPWQPRISNSVNHLLCLHDKTRTSNDEPIDAVVLWVNGADPKWLLKRREFLPDALVSENVDRFKNNEEIRWCLRSLNTNAKWVRTIYLVTDNQRPDWLAETDRLRVISHSDFIPKEFLPFFSSCAIEMLLDKIPNLSEQFLYLNDDMMLLKPTEKTDFIHPDGIARFFPRPHKKKCALTHKAFPQSIDIVEFNSCLAASLLQGFPAKVPWPAHQACILTRTGIQRSRDVLFPEFVKGTIKSKFRSTSYQETGGFSQYVIAAIDLIEERSRKSPPPCSTYLQNKAKKIPVNSVLLCLNNFRSKKAVSTLCAPLLPESAPWETSKSNI